MAISKEEALRRRQFRFSYKDLKAMTSLPDSFIKDYIEAREEVTTLNEESSTLQEQVAVNTQTNIDQQDEIDSNTLGVSNNADNIAANAIAISDHIGNTAGAHAASAISYDGTTSGYTAIEVQAAIDEGAANLDTHEALTAAHGVTGDNVGTEDYAQTAIGGAVLLADLVADVSATTTVIATADVGAAPATYDQAYADQQTALTNECKAKINSLINNDVLDLITQFNDLLQQMKDAKQMNTV